MKIEIEIYPLQKGVLRGHNIREGLVCKICRKAGVSRAVRCRDRARVDRDSSLAVVPTELSLVVMGWKDLHASCVVRKRVLCKELDREPREVVFGIM